MTVKTGTTLVFTYGNENSRNWLGPFTVLKDMNQIQVIKEYRDQLSPPHPWPMEYIEDDFTCWLEHKGYIEEIANSFTWDLGDYGVLEANCL